MSYVDTAVFEREERKRGMNLDEKIKKSDMDLEKAKMRLAKIQQENQRLKDLKAKKEKEEREKRQKALGEFVESRLGTIDLNDPKFIEFLDCVRSDFVNNSPSEQTTADDNPGEEAHEQIDSEDENQENEISGFRYES